ncbi:MAG: acyl-CoA desaturase [Spirochaetia bacterium]|nr:acyl-CoA desaturase [Spirochaetia bacterium]
MEKIKFTNKDKTEFFKTLKQRVDDYFKTNGIKKTANGKMIIKTMIMLLIFFVPYALILSKMFNIWQMYLLVIIMGFGVAGIGLSIMHDANHGAYSKHQYVNELLGFTLNLVGAASSTWKIQHNLLHHTYTNIYHYDEDIDPNISMRFTAEAKRKKYHYFQYIYALVLYGFLTFAWVLYQDYVQLAVYKKKGLIGNVKSKYINELIIMTITKIFYYIYILVIPVIILKDSVEPWQFAVAFFTMHFVTGVVLSVVFQTAHVVEGTTFPKPDANNNIEDEWAIHQMKTTSNFSRRNLFLSWYIGGLNYQIEHHLFPKICHIHYRLISKIVRETAKEFEIPYLEQPTFGGAIYSHLKLLKKLGQNNTV